MLLATRRSVPQRRGLARRDTLEQAARELLRDHELDELSLGDVARHAGVPVSSAYHFYGDIRDLYAALLAKIGDEALGLYRKPLLVAPHAWPDVMAAFARKGMRFFEGDPAAARLMVGPKTPADLKLRDRANDVALGRLLEEQMSRYFVLPTIPDRSRVFFRAIEIADLMFCLSMVEHGRITRDYTDEAIRAAVGYLGSYLPEKLPRRR
jgi:AcrR family transcriptional regulator